MPSDENSWIEKESYCEVVASQEEIYLEETEEEVYEVLVHEDEIQLQRANAHCVDVPLADRLQNAVEELITGDSDDPPLSDEEVANMLKPS